MPRRRTRRLRLASALACGALLLAACSEDGDPASVTGTTPGAGSERVSDTATEDQETAHRGRLLGEAVIGIHQVGLPDGGEEEVVGEDGFRAGHTAAVQKGEPVVHTAYLPLGPQALTVRTHRLDGGGQELASEYSWPETELANRVRALAVSPDGAHYAAVIVDGPSTYLEAVDSQTDQVVFSGRDREDRTLGLVGDDLLWPQEHGLVYVAEPDGQAGSTAGGVVGVALEELQKDAGEVSMSLLLGLDDEAWEGGRPEHLALSPDESRLAYVYVPEAPTPTPTSPPTSGRWTWPGPPNPGR